MPRRNSEQFELFSPPDNGAGSAPKPPSDRASESSSPKPSEAPRPSAADEAEATPQIYGEGARYVPPQSRAERAARKRRIKGVIDDALARMGVAGRQLLDDNASPIARARRAEEAKRNKRAG